eukprot:8810446-Pyramimonas_sp.AAC.1
MRGNLGRVGYDVHSRRQAGRGPVPWVEPALTGITASSMGLPGVPIQGGDSSDNAWPWSTTAHRLLLRDFFCPAQRCDFCGSWMLRDPTGRRCITCHRLANPWSYN